MAGAPPRAPGRRRYGGPRPKRDPATRGKSRECRAKRLCGPAGVTRRDSSVNGCLFEDSAPAPDAPSAPFASALVRILHPTTAAVVARYAFFATAPARASET